MSGSISRNINGGFSISSGLSVQGAIQTVDVQVVNADGSTATSLNAISSDLSNVQAQVANLTALEASDVLSLSGNISSLSSTVTSNYANLNTSIATLDDFVETLADTTASEFLNTNANISAINSRLVTAESELANINIPTDIIALQSNIANIKTEVIGLESNVSSLTSEVDQLQTQVGNLNLSSIVNELSAFESTTSNSITQLNANITSINSDISNLSIQTGSNLQSSLTGINANIASLTNRSDSIFANINNEGAFFTRNNTALAIEVGKGLGGLNNDNWVIYDIESANGTHYFWDNLRVASNLSVDGSISCQTIDNLNSQITSVNANVTDINSNVASLTTAINNEITTRTANIATLTSALNGKQNTITTASYIDAGTLHCTTALLIDQGTNLQNGVAFNNGTIQWNQQTNSGSHFESTSASSGSNKLISSGAVYAGLATKQNTITSATGITCGAITSVQACNFNAGASILGTFRLDASAITGNAIDSVALTNQEAKIPTSYTVWTEIQKYTPTTTFNSTVSSINSNVSTLTTNLNNEISTRQSNVATITTNLNNEISTRQSNVSTLTSLINTKAPLTQPTINNSLIVSDGWNTLTLTPNAILFSDIANSMINSTVTSQKDTVVTQNSANVITSGAVYTALTTKANLASPTFTGTVSGITKSMVGLGSVDNTSDASKPVSTAQQTALDLKAPLANPTFTGTVACPALTVNGVAITTNGGGGSSLTSITENTTTHKTNIGSSGTNYDLNLYGNFYFQNSTSYLFPPSATSSIGFGYPYAYTGTIDPTTRLGPFMKTSSGWLGPGSITINRTDFAPANSDNCPMKMMLFFTNKQNTNGTSSKIAFQEIILWKAYGNTTSTVDIKAFTRGPGNSTFLMTVGTSADNITITATTAGTDVYTSWIAFGAI